MTSNTNHLPNHNQMLLIFTKESAFSLKKKSLLVLLIAMACELVKYIWKDGQAYLSHGSLPYTIGTQK